MLRDALVRAAIAERAAAAAEPAARAPRASVAPSAGASALWAYGVLGADADLPPDLAGRRPRRTRSSAVRAGGLVALVSRVAAGRVRRRAAAREPQRPRVARARRPRPRGRARPRAAGRDLVPLRLCTIYESVEGLRAMLDARAPTSLAAALGQLDGREEWCGQAARRHRRAAARGARAERRHRRRRARRGGAGARAAPTCCGAASSARARARRAQVAAEVAEACTPGSQARAVDAVTRTAPQNPELSGPRGRDAAQRRPTSSRPTASTELRALVAELERDHGALGARLELTGPWPAVQLRPRRRRNRAMSTAVADQEVALIDLVDRLLGGGVVIAGDITLAVADVDLVYVQLRALVSSVATAAGEGPPPATWAARCDRAATPSPTTRGRRCPTSAACAPCPRRRVAAAVRRGRGDRASAAALWRHEEVVEALMEDRDAAARALRHPAARRGEVAARAWPSATTRCWPRSTASAAPPRSRCASWPAAERRRRRPRRPPVVHEQLAGRRARRHRAGRRRIARAPARRLPRRPRRQRRLRRGGGDAPARPPPPAPALHRPVAALLVRGAMTDKHPARPARPRPVHARPAAARRRAPATDQRRSREPRARPGPARADRSSSCCAS